MTLFRWGSISNFDSSCLSLTHSVSHLISDAVCALIDDNRQLSRNPMRGLFPTSEQKGIKYWTLLISVGPCLTLYLFTPKCLNLPQLWERSRLVSLSHSHTSRPLPINKIIFRLKLLLLFNRHYFFLTRLLFQDFNSCQAPTGARGAQIQIPE